MITLSQFPLTFLQSQKGMQFFILKLMTITGEIFQGRIFLNSASATAAKFCEWVQVRIDVYIPHYKYKVQPHLSPWFLAACVAAIAHRKHFFHLN